MHKGTFFTGPSGPSQVRTSFRRVRGLAAAGIALCAVFFFLYAFRIYTIPDADSDAYRSILYPQTPLHSGLSDPPPGFYKDRPENPFAGSNHIDNTVHHQLSEDGPLSESDNMHNPNAVHGQAPQEPDRPDETSADQRKDDETEASNDGDDASVKPVTIIEDDKSGSTGKSPTNPDGLTTTVVVGRTDAGVNGTEWIYDALRDITESAIYIVDDPEAPLHLNQNKGRESMVYIKYIMEHYDKLSDVTIFFHSSRQAWHNNILANKDGAVMINNLRRQHVIEEGYFNMRCELHPGCPQWILFNATREENKHHHPERFSDLFSVHVWDELFPNRTHDPIYLSQPCCSQYALSRDKIRSLPLSTYVRIHDFLATSRVADGYLGRIMEYVWQFLWLDKDEHCPSMSECYCKGYGVCLQGEDVGALTEWNDARHDEDNLLTQLGEYDSEHCNPIDEVMERRECKKANPIMPLLSDARKKAATVMDQSLKKYIMTEA